MMVGVSGGGVVSEAEAGWTSPSGCHRAKTASRRRGKFTITVSWQRGGNGLLRRGAGGRLSPGHGYNTAKVVQDLRRGSNDARNAPVFQNPESSRMCHNLLYCPIARPL
ncbi:hypothetical protein Pmani_014862 [Petrolisthes manimaculis]|uniref:Uncharacterized protein n=1 Tax=Petrolisthes manimaculis TaxID=1843537 RepID=A0AAE1UCM6_9EUCA|nr:hypothetical protein Pmani_014862 [Petrolisthes manimaculis]